MVFGMFERKKSCLRGKPWKTGNVGFELKWLKMKMVSDIGQIVGHHKVPLTPLTD